MPAVPNYRFDRDKIVTVPALVAPLPPSTSIVTRQENRASLDVYEHPVGQITMAIDRVYSAVDITYHDLNIKGQIQKTIARTRAQHHPFYSQLLFDD